MAHSVVGTSMKGDAIHKNKINNHFLLIWYWGQHKQSEYLTGKKIEHSVCYNIRYCSPATNQTIFFSCSIISTKYMVIAIHKNKIEHLNKRGENCSAKISQ